MQLQLVSRVLGALSLVFAVPYGATSLRADAADAAGRMTHSSEAPSLVQAALDAQLAGDAAARSELLSEAIEADPDFAPARWQSGQVKFNGQWRTPADVQNIVAHHPRWTEYRNLRESLGGTQADHRTLAEFCDEHGLANEARFHWANVLLAAPRNEQARKRLGLEVYRGALFTHEQVAEWKQRDKEARETFERLKPELTELCRQATGGDEARRTAAFAKLRAIDDVAALEALDAAITKAATKSPRYAAELSQAFVAALANMPQHEATLRLLNIAVFWPEQPLRDAAALALASRPQTDYVPLLMAALTAPVDYQVDVIASPDGTVRMNQTLFQPGAESAARHINSVNYETEGVMNYDKSQINPGQLLANNLSNAQAIAAATQQQVDNANAQAAEMNDRIEAVLRVTSKYDAGSNVERWWAAWQQQNELQYASEEVAVVESREETTTVFQFAQERPIDPTFVPERAPTHAGCFKPGTLVWTQAGPVAIENVAIGDLVLAKSPQTGELGYRAVLGTTHGRPTKVMRMRLPHEEIVATLGHRFWVDGRGWAMTKSLNPGAQLHALGGPVIVEALLKEEDIACHNLIVDEFHTYFVGETKLLVHDITCPAPAVAGVPGSEKVRSLPPLDAPMQLGVAAW